MRYENWVERLYSFVDEMSDKPFAWGEHDCCLFAAGAIFAITGHDYAFGLRGTYSTEKEAYHLIKKMGGIKSIVGKALGDEIKPLMAQRGDLVLIDGEHGDTLGICLGASCVAPGEFGLTYLPFNRAISAWRVN